jgi:hypothetical protein
MSTLNLIITFRSAVIVTIGLLETVIRSCVLRRYVLCRLQPTGMVRIRAQGNHLCQIRSHMIVSEHAWLGE